MILPTAVFSTVQLIATFLHWDKFSVGSTPFYVWFASYLLPPLIFRTAYLWHQRHATPAPRDADTPLPAWMRTLFWVIGIGLIFLAAGAFVLPSLLIQNFPWQLTPLTTRSLCGWIMILGVVLISMVRENDRARVRFATPLLILVLPTLLLQMSRFADQVDWRNSTLWIGLATTAVLCVCGIYLALGNWGESLR